MHLSYIRNRLFTNMSSRSVRKTRQVRRNIEFMPRGETILVCDVMCARLSWQSKNGTVKIPLFPDNVFKNRKDSKFEFFLGSVITINIAIHSSWIDFIYIQTFNCNKLFTPTYIHQ